MRVYRRPFVVGGGIDVFQITPKRGLTDRKFDTFDFFVAENGFATSISLDRPMVWSLVWYLIKELL